MTRRERFIALCGEFLGEVPAEVGSRLVPDWSSLRWSPLPLAVRS